MGVVERAPIVVLDMATLLVKLFTKSIIGRVIDEIIVTMSEKSYGILLVTTRFSGTYA